MARFGDGYGGWGGGVGAAWRQRLRRVSTAVGALPIVTAEPPLDADGVDGRLNMDVAKKTGGQPELAPAQLARTVGSSGQDRRRLRAVEAATPLRPQDAQPAPGDHYGAGRAQRLTKAFQAIEAFPALAEARERLLRLLDGERVSNAELVKAIESDVALTLRVLHVANEAPTPTAGRVETVPQAVELLTPEALRTLANSLRTFDFFEHSGVWDTTPERFRLHALATQQATDCVAAEIGYEHRDRLTAISLLHDVGKLVLMHAYPGYPSMVQQNGGTPEQRVHQERRELGVDHTLMGGVFARRWGLPASIASAIERHHNPEVEGEAALVRLGDMLAHYCQGTPVSPVEMLAGARAVGLGPAKLRSIMYELPQATNGRRRHVDPCPLSQRELGVLQRLAEGKVYKQIAQELMLSTSTVRTHLHNIYGKLGAVDRAQAVLIATERGWL
jgi:HD-like signal output (HDOD) protein/DNA-binding CsgD family transcriptional regulator